MSSGARRRLRGVVHHLAEVCRTTFGITVLSSSLALCCAGGGARGSPPSSGPDRAADAGFEPLHLGPLTDYVPAAGLRWLIVAEPRYFFEHPALQEFWQRQLGEGRLAAFARATGVDLGRTRHALAAGFDLGTLYMVDGSGWVSPPDEPFTERLAGSELVHRPHPGIWRVTGLAGSTPETLVRVQEQLVAVAVRDPTPARVVELIARGRAQRVTRALDGAALGGLPAELRAGGPLAAYVLGPFEGRWVAEGRGMLAAAHSLALVAQLGPDGVRLSLAVAGYWDPERDVAALRSLWQAAAESALGRSVGLDRPLAAPAIAAESAALVLRVTLPLEHVLHGLGALWSGPLPFEPAAPAAAPTDTALD